MCKTALRAKFFKDNNIRGIAYSKTKDGDLEVTVKSVNPGEYFSSNKTYLFKKGDDYKEDSFMSQCLNYWIYTKIWNKLIFLKY